MSNNIRSIDEVNVAGKRVLVRADLNVPMNAAGEVTDATRIERFLPTVKDLVERKAKVVILTHFGRPKGRAVPEMTCLPVAKKLALMLKEAGLLNAKVKFAENVVGPAAIRAVDGLEEGEVALMENLRFHEGEEGNDEGFAQELAKLGDIYVNDAFSCSHRAHASTHAIAWLLPAYAGPSMKKELDALQKVTTNPDKPVAAVVGGAKVSTKITVLKALSAKMDLLIIGGGMANTFLYAHGIKIGKSLCEPDFADMAKEIMAEAEKNGCKIMIPHDVVVANEFKAHADNVAVDVHNVPDDSMILDAGPESVEALKVEIQKCKTLLWNGPMGAFEMEPFGIGTFELAREAGRLTREGKLETVAGGGDTVAALNMAGVSDQFTYISTAGGAFLELLEGRELPGVVALEIGNKS